MNLRIDNHLDADYFERSLREDVINGLGSGRKELPPKWFYDDLGSDLFDQITRLPEYYPTEAERSILRERADEIAGITAADTLVELGSGSVDKTRVLLDALHATGQLQKFVPFDVSEGILRSSSAAIIDEYPGIDVHGVVGDFEHHLNEIPMGGRKITALLGGTVGNFDPTGRKELLTRIVGGMTSGDWLLLGTDLVKDRGRLVAAYDDAQGVTAAFNKNVLQVLNTRLRADFDLDNFDHVARFDETEEWIEMRLRSTVEQTVRVADLDLTVQFEAGEEMRTEISSKFRRAKVQSELEDVGLQLSEFWTDTAGDYAVSLSVLP